MTTPADALTAVAAALDALAEALASGQPDLVLAAESAVSGSVRALNDVRPRPGDRRADVRAHARAVLAALSRCERLGRISADYERLLLPRREYGPGADGVPRPISSIRGARV